jgi:SAM-dependent methyltransferase
MAEMFTSGTAYERMMGRWSTRLAPLFINFARVRNGARILDVGCGTGSLVQAMADLGGGSEIVGIDPAQPFIDYCRKRFADPRVTFDRGNAIELPFPNDSFDHSLSLLVFQFIPQPGKAASEMRRVTRPGGTIAACTWDTVGGGLEMSAIFWEEAARLDLAAEARAERPRHCNRKGELAALWQETGLDAVEETALEMQTDFSSFDDYWLPYTGGVGPQGVYVADISSESRNSLCQALRNRLLGDQPDGPFSLRAKAWAVRGTVPTH